MDKTVEMTDEELEQELLARRKARAEKRAKEREAYEKRRDALVSDLIARAKHLSELNAAFKKEAAEKMAEHFEILTEYGEIRGNSKGGFGLPHSSATMKVVRTRDTRPDWDERAAKGEALIKEVLHEKAKRGGKYLPVILGFLERNSKGDLENSKVMNLLKYRDLYDDPRWSEGLQLIEESFSVVMRGYGYEFHVTDDQGKWQTIPMNFSSL